jgi:hypothetical protein
VFEGLHILGLTQSIMHLARSCIINLQIDKTKSQNAIADFIPAVIVEPSDPPREVA